MPWDLMFVGETQSGYGASAGHLDEDDRTGGMTPFSGGSTSSVPFLQQGSGTVLLNPGKDESEIGLRLLRALDDGEPDIRIAYYPFIIGKQENLVDHVLNRETVSRLHLRIDQKDGHYYVQDLNSTNGTMVDGRMLENNETDRSPGRNRSEHSRNQVSVPVAGGRRTVLKLEKKEVGC